MQLQCQRRSLFDEYVYVQIDGWNPKALLYFWEDLPSCQIKVHFNTSQRANGFEKAQSLFNSAVLFRICWWIVFLLSVFVGTCVCVCVRAFGGKGRSIRDGLRV